MLYELEGLPKELAKEAFHLAAAKLPVKTRFMDRSEQP
jgi:large subunit ribosomal protein L16